MTSRRRKRYSAEFEAARDRRLEVAREKSKDIREQALLNVLQDVAAMASH